jgi:hypothetical protein
VVPGGAAVRISYRGDGDGLVQSLEGASGLCTCGNGVPSGIGGVGRIQATATILSGTTNPAL